MQDPEKESRSKNSSTAEPDMLLQNRFGNNSKLHDLVSLEKKEFFSNQMSNMSNNSVTDNDFVEPKIQFQEEAERTAEFIG